MPGNRAFGYFPALTGLRAVAAGLVFFNHFCRHVNRGHVFDPLTRLLADIGGVMGVSIFFTLSGFLITAIYYDKIRDRQISFGQYWFRRFARIWPLFAFLIILKTLLCRYVFVSLYWHDEAMRSGFGWQLLADLTFAQALFPQYIWSGISTGWTLTTEECFYLTTPFVLLLIAWFEPRARAPSSERYRWLARVTALLGVAGAFFWQLGTWLHQAHWGSLLGDEFQAHANNFFGKYVLFAPGMWIALLIHRFSALENNPKRRWINGVLAVSVAMHLIYGWIVAVEPQVSIPAWQALTLILSMGTALLIGCIVQGSSIVDRILGNRVVEYLGRTSFALYLLQESFYAFGIAGILERISPSLRSNVVVNYVAFNLAAALAYELIEKPAHRLFLFLLPARNSRQSGKLWAR